ncbi:MAG TPA: hypothetical protein VF665_16910 [Longimicrobium sp.]|jgi:hypothetical protein|uniref:hypothetical protein n=1 Tax=Longimicrobium sp. TaxID=2029185 RepID=UPI002EDAD320
MRLRTIIAAAGALALGACAPAIHRPPAEQILVYRGRDVEVTLRDGRRVELVNPQVTADSAFGAWTPGANPPSRVAVALADVVAVRVTSPSAMQREVAREARRTALWVLVAPVLLLGLLVFGPPS